MEIRKVITEHELACILSDAYCNCLDNDVLNSKDKNNLKWFEYNSNIVKYILYNEFDIEVVKEIKE